MSIPASDGTVEYALDINSHAHTEGSSRVSNQTKMHVSGLWEGSGVAKENPQGHEEKMQTPPNGCFLMT